jgi:hypothetical protein
MKELSFVNCERSVIRTALNLLWQKNVREKFLPLKIKDDEMLNKYHSWCRIQEKDKMSDFYWIQKIRKKLNLMEKFAKDENSELNKKGG